METFSALLAICAGNSPVPVNSPQKGQWWGALICACINCWVNNHEAGDLRCYRAHYDVIVMINQSLYSQQTPHISPSWSKYAVSVVRMLEEFDNVLIPPHCKILVDAMSHLLVIWSNTNRCLMIGMVAGIMKHLSVDRGLINWLTS